MVADSHIDNLNRPDRKVGLRPTDPERLAAAKRMGRFLLTSVLPTHPDSADYMAKIKKWILGGNDRFGTCGPTSVANFVLLVTSWLAAYGLEFTDDEVFDLYRRSGNPNFNPATGADDNGVDMTVMLTELVRGGIGFGDRNVKALAFAALPDSHDTEQLWGAAVRFGGVLWGADLAQAQDKQTTAGLWDYVARSRSWGGHAILAGPRFVDQPGTAADRTGLVTWAEPINATDTFIGKQVAEAYIVILPWHLQDKTFLANTDLATLAADYTEITGKPFPVVVPTPPVDPNPPVDPPPTPADADRLLAAAFDDFTSSFNMWRSARGV